MKIHVRTLMRSKCFLFLGCLVLVSPNAFSHGMNKPGPHGGFIRMPGAFHTEVVPLSENEWNIYLLDENFKNPITKNSSINAYIQTGQKKLPLTCTPQPTFFACSFMLASSRGNRPKLHLEVIRNAIKGIAIYNLPLKFE